MFLPTRMTRIVLGGHKSHMEDVIGTLQDEGLVHLEDFLDPTKTTKIGTPLEAGEQASALLVRVRGLQKSLGAEGMQAKRIQADDPERILADTEKTVLPVIEEAAALRSSISALDAEATALSPFADLDADLAGLHATSSIRGYIGTTRDDPSGALQAAGLTHEVVAVPYGSGHAVMVFVAANQADKAERLLADAGFTAVNLPGSPTGTPAGRLAEIAEQRKRMEAKLAAAEQKILALRDRYGPRLASLERHLVHEVDRTQAPLQFAVTETTFHAEGWIPAKASNRIRNVITARFGESVYFEDLGDAPRSHEETPHGAVGHHHHEHEGHGHDDHETDPSDEAPVQLQNPKLAKPYEFLLSLLGRPRYQEIDPTKLMLLFFPLFFGFMVGDVLVGLLVVFVGLLVKNHRIFGIGGPAVSRILVLSGVMATLFGGVVFGEALGIHFVVDDHALEEGEPSWESILGLDIPEEGFLHKTGDHNTATTQEGTTGSDGGAHLEPLEEEAEERGGLLTPHSDTHLSVNGWFNLGYYSKVHDIQALLVWSILIAFVHLNLGFLLGFRNVLVAHGRTMAVQEKLSWITAEAGVGLVVWGLVSAPAWVLALGVGIFIASMGLLWQGVKKALGAPGFVAILEFLGFSGNLLSYTRLAAIGASKAGMALAFMAIGFDVLGGGSYHSVVGWVVYGLGMVVITALAILSGGLQSLRLQFVEFFQKFYTGGGRPYVPFGGRRA